MAILASFKSLGSLVKDRRVVISRATLIKGSSTSAAMHALAVAFAHLGAQCPSVWYIARVPSHSNPGDAPSRGRDEEVLALVSAQQVEEFPNLDQLVGDVFDAKVPW